MKDVSSDYKNLEEPTLTLFMTYLRREAMALSTSIFDGTGPNITSYKYPFVLLSSFPCTDSCLAQFPVPLEQYTQEALQDCLEGIELLTEIGKLRLEEEEED